MRRLVCLTPTIKVGSVVDLLHAGFRDKLQTREEFFSLIKKQHEGLGERNRLTTARPPA
jgi:hypothetical protein